MLERLGFGDTTISQHTQSHHLGHVMSDEPYAMPMWTVVGRRT
jgi:peptide methionine sulfoxide reductase MsrB